MKTRALTTHLPLPLAEKVDAMASRLDRSEESIVKQAVADWVDREERRYSLTLEALLDVDEGNLVDHQSVLNWAESLDEGDAASLPR